jgi:hypothetical protein
VCIRIRKVLENKSNMEDDRVAILEAQLAQAKLIAEEADKKYEEVSCATARPPLCARGVIFWWWWRLRGWEIAWGFFHTYIAHVLHALLLLARLHTPLLSFLHTCCTSLLSSFLGTCFKSLLSFL